MVDDGNIGGMICFMYIFHPLLHFYINKYLVRSHLNIQGEQSNAHTNRKKQKNYFIPNYCNITLDVVYHTLIGSTYKRPHIISVVH